MRCVACNEGEIVAVTSPGRRWRYRNIPDLELPADLAIPTCSLCGEEFIDRAVAAEIDRALTPRFEALLTAKAQQALGLLGKQGVPQRELEPLLGLSAGYLSKVKRGKETSAQLVAALMLLGTDAGGVERLRKLWAADANLELEERWLECWTQSGPAEQPFVAPPDEHQDSVIHLFTTTRPRRAA